MGKFQQILSCLFSPLGYKGSRWRTEKKISRKAILSRRVHFSHVLPSEHGENAFNVNPSCFNDNELSCDWNKYSTPVKSLSLIGKEHKKSKSNVDFKDPNDFFICSLVVDDVLKLNIEQSIKHNPVQHIPEKIGVPNNRAHTLVYGDKAGQEFVKRRLLFSNISKWEIFDKDRLQQLLEKRAGKI